MSTDTDTPEAKAAAIARVWLQTLPAGRYPADRRARAALEDLIARAEDSTGEGTPEAAA